MELPPFQVSTFVGSVSGDADGVGNSAMFNSPNGMAVDRDGTLYVADAGNHRIRKVSKDGEVSILAGSERGYADAAGKAARFALPYGVAVDQGLNVYVADTYNHRIRKISPNGEVTTVAGSGAAGFKDAAGLQAQFNLPFSLDIDDLGNLFVADAGNHRIRKISPLGVVSTVAGTGSAGRTDGNASQARFAIPNDLALDATRNIYVADYGNHCIRKISYGGEVTTVAGNGLPGTMDGIGSGVQFRSPTGLCVDTIGNIIVADSGNNIIRKISPTGQVRSIVISGATPASNLDSPTDVVAFGEILYVADTGNSLIRIIK